MENNNLINLENLKLFRELLKKELTLNIIDTLKNGEYDKGLADLRTNIERFCLDDSSSADFDFIYDVRSIHLGELVEFLWSFDTEALKKVTNYLARSVPGGVWSGSFIFDLDLHCSFESLDNAANVERTWMFKNSPLKLKMEITEEDIETGDVMIWIYFIKEDGTALLLNGEAPEEPTPASQEVDALLAQIYTGTIKFCGHYNIEYLDLDLPESELGE